MRLENPALLPSQVLHFWFSHRPHHFDNATPPAEFIFSGWFDKSSQWQQDCLKNRPYWLSVYHSALSGNLDEWQSSPEGALALCLVLDQIPRMLFPNEVRALDGGVKALDVAEAALAREDHLAVPPNMRFWLYMPFMHSETLEHQELSVSLFEDLCQTAPGSQPLLKSARAHHEAVQLFGRLPSRNMMLGRASTIEEQRYLAVHPSP